MRESGSMEKRNMRTEARMDIDRLVDAMREDPDCEVYPPIGQPVLKNPDDTLPADLTRFYTLCGGADLYMSQDFGFRVVPPTELVPATPILTSFRYEEAKNILDKDISAPGTWCVHPADQKKTLLLTCTRSDLGRATTGI